jgi:hypothetical protein
MLGLTPEEEFLWRDYVVLFLKESQLLSKRICTYQIAVENGINDFVPCWKNPVIGEHNWSSSSCAPEISALGQTGIGDVLQQWAN